MALYENFCFRYQPRAVPLWRIGVAEVLRGSVFAEGLHWSKCVEGSAPTLLDGAPIFGRLGHKKAYREHFASYAITAL